VSYKEEIFKKGKLKKLKITRSNTFPNCLVRVIEILGPLPLPHTFQLVLPSELGGGESYTHISILPPPHPQRISSSFTLDRRLDRHWQTGRGRGWTGNGRLGEDEGGQALADR
jgi:hypothetical protein